MKKGVKIALWIGVPLAVIGGSFYAYGVYKRRKFDKACIGAGGTIVESGYQCSNK
jgi:hypothetical protein